MPYLGIFGLKLKKTIVIFEISTLQFVKLQNFAKKQKCLICDQKCFIWVVLDQNFKTIVVFEISTLKFIKNESLTLTVNFGIGFAFSKGPGSAFSECPGPGPGPLCKVCQTRADRLSNNLRFRSSRPKVFCKAWFSLCFICISTVFYNLVLNSSYNVNMIVCFNLSDINPI